MNITYDPAKRARTLLERGLDFADVWQVLLGPHCDFEDTRKDYGETRMICYGYLADVLVMVGYVQRGNDCHVFSMRKANDREKRRIAPQIGF